MDVSLDPQEIGKRRERPCGEGCNDLAGVAPAPVLAAQPVADLDGAGLDVGEGLEADAADEGAVRGAADGVVQKDALSFVLVALILSLK